MAVLIHPPDSVHHHIFPDVEVKGLYTVHQFIQRFATFFGNGKLGGSRLFQIGSNSHDGSRNRIILFFNPVDLRLCDFMSELNSLLELCYFGFIDT
ncbi:hypothetical protein M8494_33600 (plasmid) [Serratia ureilytica]